MENSSLKTYFFKEKFFQVSPENRIRRYQYLARLLTLGILLLILSFVFSFILGMIAQILGLTFMRIYIILMAFLPVILGVFYLNSYFCLSVKRSRDIGKDFKKPLKILVIADIILLFVKFFISAGLWMGIDFSLILAIAPMYEKISLIFGVVSLVVFLYLLFVPGKKWDNEFGDDPMNTKVSFFG